MTVNHLHVIWERLIDKLLERHMHWFSRHRHEYYYSNLLDNVCLQDDVSPSLVCGSCDANVVVVAVIDPRCGLFVMCLEINFALILVAVHSQQLIRIHGYCWL